MPVKEEVREILEPKRDRSENLKDRIGLFYGTSDEELSHGIRVRATYGSMLFALDPPALSSNDEMNTDTASEKIEIQGPKTEFQGFPINVNGFRLNCDETRKCATSLILNTGYTALSISWSSSNYLAIALLVSPQAPIDASLQIPATGPSLVKIYRPQLPLTPSPDISNAPNCELYASFSSNRLGTVTCVRFNDNNELACVFGSGNIGVVSVKENKDIGFDEAMTEVTNFGFKATSAAWRGPCLVVGFANGSIAEYTSAFQPKFVLPNAASSNISSIATSEHDIFVTSVDGTQSVIDTRDLRLFLKLPRLRFYSQTSVFSPLTNSFVYADDQGNARLVPLGSNNSIAAVNVPDDAVSAAGALFQHMAEITALAASEQHPIIASGCRHGSFHIINAVRKALVSRRQRDGPVECELWRLECSHSTSEYAFQELYAPVTKVKPSINQLAPFGVTVTSCAWQPNGTWVCASTASGLVRFDCLNW